MKKIGTIKRWDAARGFGFIHSRDSNADVFFHVRDFRAAPGVQPTEGTRVQFEEIHVGGKGPRAMAVQPTGLNNVIYPPGRPRSHRPINEISGKPYTNADTRELELNRVETCTPRRSNAPSNGQRWVPANDALQLAVSKSLLFWNLNRQAQHEPRKSLRFVLSQVSWKMEHNRR